MKHLVFSAIALSVAASASAESKYWIGGNGSFFDAANWKSGVPSSADAAVFYENTEAVVEIDGDREIGFWQLNARAGEMPLTGIEWIGSGSLTSGSSTSSSVQSGRRLVINGPDVTVANNMYTTNSTLCLKAGSLTVGGEAHIRAGSVFSIEGGVCKVAKFKEIADSASFRLSGGKLIYATQNELDPSNGAHFLPVGKNAILDLTDRLEKAICIRKEGETHIEGTVLITNRATSVHSGVLVYRVNHTFSGNGTIVADALRIDGGNTLTYRLPSLKLAYGLRESGTTAATYSFPCGIDFGSWGDWSNDLVSGGTPVAVSLAGDVVFDTRNCFDGKTVHSITLAEVTDEGIKSIKVRGGGCVTLKIPAGFVSSLNSLEVEDGATLDLTGMGSKRIFVRKLILGTGAVLKYDAGKTPIEVIGLQEIDGSARIEAVMAATLTEKKLYPLFDSLNPLPENVFSCALPDGWTCCVQGGRFYASDSMDFSASYGQDIYGWLGGKSSSWKEPENWQGGKIPCGSVNVNFTRVANADVVYDWTEKYVGEINQLIFDETCGPYSISGASLKPKYGSASSQSVKSSSLFPVVVHNFMECQSDPGGCFLNNGSSYIALLGGGSSKGSMRYRGDVRLGGVWTATNVLEFAKNTTSRETRLMVLSDGHLDMSAASEGMTPPTKMIVDGKVTFGAAPLDLNALEWLGNGTVEMPAGESFAESQTFRLQDSLRLVPTTDWRTEQGNGSVISCISAIGTPVLGAKRDWSYGVDGGVIDNGDVRGSLFVGYDSVLAVDTEDPDTGKGHSITFARPVCGEGSLIKVGAGTLIFCTGDSRLDGDFSVAEGALALGGVLRTRAASGWTDMFAARSFKGVDAAFGRHYECRTVEREDGLKTFQVRSRISMRIIVR